MNSIINYGAIMRQFTFWLIPWEMYVMNIFVLILTRVLSLMDLAHYFIYTLSRGKTFKSGFYGFINQYQCWEISKKSAANSLSCWLYG